jgi:hypothetical protein
MFTALTLSCIIFTTLGLFTFHTLRKQYDEYINIPDTSPRLSRRKLAVLIVCSALYVMWMCNAITIGVGILVVLALT